MFLYNNLESALIDNANQSNEALLEQAQIVVDSRIKEIDQLTLQIALNPNLQLLLYSEESTQPLDPYKYIEFIRELGRYRTVSNFIEDYYVYFSDTDVILTGAIKTNSQMFYHFIHQYQGKETTEILDKLTSYQFKTYIPSQSIRFNNAGKNMITYVQSLPLGEQTNTKGSLVMLIDEYKIKELLLNHDALNGAFYILNSDREIILRTDMNEDNIDRIMQGLNSMMNEQYTLADQTNIISYRKSNMNGWTYVSVVPKEVVLSRVNEVKSLALFLVILCLLAGILVSYFLTYKNHNPIREVIYAILKVKNDKSEIRQINNEFDFIKDAVVSSMNEGNQLRTELNQQAPVIKADFIMRLFKGNVYTSTMTKKDLEFMGLNFHSNDFRVVIINIDDCNRFIQEDTEREWSLIRFIIMNLSQDLLQNKGYVIEIERDRIAILMNHSHVVKEGELNLNDFIKDLKEVVELRFKTWITLAISSSIHGLERIPKAYAEAIIALEFKMIHGQNSVIYYEEIKHQKHENFYYSMETETHLINYAKSGNYEIIKKILDQVFENNFHENGISPEMGKCLFLEMFSTILKILNSMNKRYIDEVFEGEESPVKYFLRIETIEEMQIKLKEIYLKICDIIDEERTDHSEQLIQTIESYIQENYTDSNLSLTLIADHCGLNSSYLSSFYKKHSGQNVSEYLASVRISNAKKLLRESLLTVSQISEQVGYTNDVGLIRVFKKIEGVTPGKYREGHIKKLS